MLTSQKVKEYAKNCGADIVGIGSTDRFEGAPAQCDPRNIMPEAKSIIGLGFRIHRGLLRGIEEGTYFAGYPAMGYAGINDIYAPVVMREIANMLEDCGYEALPFHNTSARLGTGAGEPVSPGKPKPDVFLHFRIAGFICGMGEIGYSKLLLTPEFGPRQRLSFILTDAPLAPDPLFEGKICDRCKLCVKDCPAGAVNPEETVSISIAGRQIEWGKLDERKCSAVYQAGSPEYSPFISGEVKSTLRNILSEKGSQQEHMTSYAGNIWRYLEDNVPSIQASWKSFHHPAAIGGARGCIRACMAHLEKEGRLKNRFKQPFRRRPQWEKGPAF